MISLSSSVSAPNIFSSTFLPCSREILRTIRDIFSKSCPTGIIRISMTPFCSSVNFLSSPFAAFDSSSARVEKPSFFIRSVNSAMVEWQSTSSPTIFISSSSLAISTRTVWLKLLAEREASSPPAEGVSPSSATASCAAESSRVTATFSPSTMAITSSVFLSEPYRISKSMENPNPPPELGRVLMTSPSFFRISVNSPKS